MTVQGLRRYLPPPSTKMVLALATVVAILAVSSVVIAVSALLQVHGIARENCRQIEQVKLDTRMVLRGFGVTRSELPARADGSRPFDQRPGGCDVL